MLMENNFPPEAIDESINRLRAQTEKWAHLKLDPQPFLSGTLVTELWLKSVCIDLIQKQAESAACALLDEFVEQGSLTEEDVMRIADELCESVSELREDQ